MIVPTHIIQNPNKMNCKMRDFNRNCDFSIISLFLSLSPYVCVCRPNRLLLSVCYWFFSSINSILVSSFRTCKMSMAFNHIEIGSQCYKGMTDGMEKICHIFVEISEITILFVSCCRAAAARSFVRSLAPSLSVSCDLLRLFFLLFRSRLLRHWNL